MTPLNIQYEAFPPECSIDFPHLPDLLPCMCSFPIRHLGQHPNIVQLIDVYDNEGGATRFQHSLPGTFGWMGKWNSLKSSYTSYTVYIYIYIEMQASLYCRINHETNATTIWEWYVFDRYSNLDQTCVWNWIWYDSMDSTWIYKFDPIRSSHKSLFHWSCPNGSKSLSV